MEFLGNWASQTMFATVGMDDSMLYVKLTGMVKLQGYFEAAAYAAGVAVQGHFATTIIDTRSAIVLITEDELLTAVPGRSALAVKWRPGAFLVGHDHEGMFQRLCWRLAHEYGLERAVFTSGRAAAAWATETATRARVKAALRASKILLRAQQAPTFALSETGGL